MSVRTYRQASANDGMECPSNSIATQTTVEMNDVTVSRP